MRLLAKFFKLILGRLIPLSKKLLKKFKDIIIQKLQRHLKRIIQPKPAKNIRYIPIKRKTNLAFIVDYLMSHNIVGIDKKHLIEFFVMRYQLEQMDIGMIVEMIKNQPEFIQNTEINHQPQYWQNKILISQYNNLSNYKYHSLH